MALNIEDIFGNLTFDSGDSEKIKGKQICDAQEDLLTGSSTKSESQIYDILCEEKKTFNTDDNISQKNSPEQLEPSIVTTNILSSSSEISEQTKSLKGENDFTNNYNISETLTSADASVKSNKKTADKTNKRVHFNTEVETFMYEPGLAIMENYNYTEEFSVEHVFEDVLNERRFLWKSEGNLALRNNISSSHCPIMEEWIRCDHHFHQLRKGHFHMPEYSRLNDEDVAEVPKEDLKGWQRLKRSSSCFFRRKNDGSEKGSSSASPGNLKRQLSMSMQSLKLETKSWVDKFLTIVMKKTVENFPTSECAENGNIKDVPVKEMGDSSKLKRKSSIFSRKKKCEDKNDFSSASRISSTSRNRGLRAWKSVQNLNCEENFAETEDVTHGFEKELKVWQRLKIKGNFFRKKEPESEIASTSAMSGNHSLRSSISMQNLNIDSKSWMDKFLRRK